MTADEEMSLAEAAAQYDVSLAHLGRKVRTGEVEARKVRSPHRGMEWRVTPAALEAAGHSLRTVEPSKPLPDSDVEDTIGLTAAVARYSVTKSQLVQMLISGELPGVKGPGVNASQWRVKPEDVEAAGLLPRKSKGTTPQVIDLAAAEKAVEVEQPTKRDRVADLDSRLGHALLSAGALRRQLRDAGLTPIVFGEPLDGDDSFSG